MGIPLGPAAGKVELIRVDGRISSLAVMALISSSLVLQHNTKKAE